ncbi:MAG: hypothetical protein DLM59_13755 [Pseudonocardiales bacterium]|nr:MAG: hypothetical protein DLM59_13755 [Pseudonocardiales bacterium]
MRRLLTGATIWAGAGCVPRPGWLLVDGDRISEVGDAGDSVPEADEVVEASGRHILPGFVDVHSHLTVAAWMPRGGDGAAWRGLGDAVDGVRRVASAAPDAPWLVFWNVSMHAWPEGRLPTAEELDAAAPGRRVLICGIDLHRGVISRAAFEDLGLAATRPGQLAGDLGRDLRGRPTGELWEAAFGSALCRAVADMCAHLDDAGVEEALHAEAGRHLAYGITHAHDPYVSPSMHERLLRLRSITPLRLSWATGSSSGMLTAPDGPATAPTGMYGDAGREVKIFLDGADRCALRLPVHALPGLVGGTAREAWRRRAAGPLREGLRRRVTLRGTQIYLPYLRFGDGELTVLLAAYAEEGFRLRLHALGNLAADQAARALAAAGVPAGAATIDHLTALDRRTADLVAASGAYASFQPGFLPRFGPQFITTGVDRHLVILGGRLLTASGVPLVLSSDHPCGPLDPLQNLRTAVSRDLGDGRILQPEQSLTRSEAVRAAALEAARSLGAVGSGGLSPGQVADLAISGGDPFDEATRIVETWVAGERVWRM